MKIKKKQMEIAKNGIGKTDEDKKDENTDVKNEEIKKDEELKENSNEAKEEDKMQSDAEVQIKRKVLPRTGADYFNLKLILINLSLGVIFLAIKFLVLKNKKTDHLA